MKIYLKPEMDVFWYCKNSNNVIVGKYINTINKYEQIYIIVNINGEDKKFLMSDIGRFIFLFEKDIDLYKIGYAIYHDVNYDDVNSIIEISYYEPIDIWLNHLKKFSFYGFLHSTSLKNFKSILSSGYIFSRNDLIRNKIIFEEKANIEVIENTDSHMLDYVRFYYYHMTPTDYESTIKLNSPKTIIIVFSEEIAYCYKNQLICDGNAAKKNVNYTIE